VLLVDTNVLVYAVNQDAEFHQECRSKLEEVRARDLPWYLSWPICYEFLRVCTHANVLTKPWTLEAAWRFLQSLLDSPAGGLLLPTLRHADVLREVISEVPHLRGNIVHDLHTAVLMREHGIREIYTRDTDFSRFPFLRVIDPLA
jgi:toxin-antitoxin system PIN domain toxin